MIAVRKFNTISELLRNADRRRVDGESNSRRIDEGFVEYWHEIALPIESFSDTSFLFGNALWIISREFSRRRPSKIEDDN